MEEQVRQLIEQVYCLKYVGFLKVQELVNCKKEHFGWKVQIGLHWDEKPIELAFDGDENQFFKSLEKQLRKMHLHTSDYFNGYRITLDPNFEGQIRPDTIKTDKPYYKASII